MNIQNFNGIKPFLFNNLSIRQTIFKNTFWLAVAAGISKFLRFILFIYVARILGATEYGKFTFALAFISLFTIFSDLGLSQITIRELAKEKEKEKEFPAIFSLKILLILGSFLLIFICSFFITPDLLIQKLILILGICVLAENFYGIIFSFFQARQKMEYQAFFSITAASLVTIAGLFILFYFPSIQNLSYSYLFAALVTLIFVLIFFHFKIQRLSLSWDKSIWQRFLIMSWPLALVGAFATIHNQIDSVMMGYFNQITQTGWYNAAYRIIAAVLILAGLLSTTFFPVLSKLFRESKEKLQNVWNYFMKTMILLALPLVAGGIVLAPKIIDFIYNPSYIPSILAFQILIIMAGIGFLYAPLYHLLIVFGQQQKFFIIFLLGAIINVILNLILIPKFSLYGAAVATVITHLLNLVLLLIFTLKFTSVNPLNLKLLLSFISAIISSFIMYIIISRPQIYNLHVLLSVPIGILIYFATLFILRYMGGIFMYSYEKK